jgi:exodeoxyribonuclease III
MTKIATWNANSVRARMTHLTAWMKQNEPDLLALQETKVQDQDFPVEEISALGWSSTVAGQKSYNGVAVLSRRPVEVVATAIPDFDDTQSRVLAVEYEGLLLLDLYVPNGASVGSEKYAYKLAWLDALNAWVCVLLQQYARVLIAGDFNIAPEDRDVHDPDAWRGKILCSDDERERLRSLLGLGFSDVFRRFDQPDGQFSWWDYRAGAFRRNHGLRIDLILASDEITRDVVGCVIDSEPRRWEKPSDHAPVVAEVEP